MNAVDLLKADQSNPPQVRRPLVRILDEAVGGDPFVRHVEVAGARYRVDESALIELEERNARRIEMEIRMGWFGTPAPR